MDDRPIKHRASSPDAIARRAERLLMAPVRRSVGELQLRVALVAGRAASSKMPESEALAAESDAIRQAIEAVAAQVEQALDGRASLGPADDCRRALQMLLGRVPRPGG